MVLRSWFAWRRIDAPTSIATNASSSLLNRARLLVTTPCTMVTIPQHYQTLIIYPGGVRNAPGPKRGITFCTVSLVLGLTNQNRCPLLPNASPSLRTTDDQSTSSYDLFDPARISRNGRRSSSSSSRGDLPTPAEAYPTPGRGATEGGVLLAGDNRARQAPAGTGVPPDMEDSIMRGPLSSNRGGASSPTSGDGAAANASAAAEELVKTFRQEHRFFHSL